MNSLEVVVCSWVEGALARAPSNANLSSAHLSSARSLLKIVECSSFEARVGVRVFRVEKRRACAKVPKHYTLNLKNGILFYALGPGNPPNAT